MVALMDQMQDRVDQMRSDEIDTAAHTNDPSQGRGSSAWQESVRRSIELNAKNRRN